MKLDLPVMLMMLVGAAGLQTLAPAMPGAFLKPPLLPAVALYYILNRQPVLALTAAFWAGILCDALGGVPAGTSALFLFAAALLLLAMRRVLPGEQWPTSVALGGVLALLLAVVQWLALRSQFASRPSWALLALNLALCGAAGAAAGGGIRALGRFFDFRAGNVKRREEIAHG